MYWCIWEVTLSTESYNYHFQFIFHLYFISPNFTLQFVIGRCWRQVIDVCSQKGAKTTVKGIWFDLIIHKWPARFHMIESIFLFGKMRFQVPIFILFLNFSLLTGLHVPKSLKRTNVFRRLRWIFKVFSEKANSETLFDMVGHIGTILIDPSLENYFLSIYAIAHIFCPIGSHLAYLQFFGRNPRTPLVRKPFWRQKSEIPLSRASMRSCNDINRSRYPTTWRNCAFGTNRRRRPAFCATGKHNPFLPYRLQRFMCL